MIEIPEKIQKGQPVREELEAKINGIIDRLRAMRPVGVGAVGVDRTPAGSVAKLSRGVRVKEITERRAVQQIVYDGPWQLEIDGENLMLHPSPVVQINGFFHLSNQSRCPTYSPLSAVFSGAAEDESFRYAVLKTGLDMIHTGSFYFDVVYVKALETFPSIREQSYFPLGEVWRWQEDGVWKYGAEPYYVGIPAMKLIFTVDLNLESA